MRLLSSNIWCRSPFLRFANAHGARMLVFLEDLQGVVCCGVERQVSVTGREQPSRFKHTRKGPATVLETSSRLLKEARLLQICGFQRMVDRLDEVAVSKRSNRLTGYSEISVMLPILTRLSTSASSVRPSIIISS